MEDTPGNTDDDGEELVHLRDGGILTLHLGEDGCPVEDGVYHRNIYLHEVMESPISLGLDAHHTIIDGIISVEFWLPEFTPETLAILACLRELGGIELDDVGPAPFPLPNLRRLDWVSYNAGFPQLGALVKLEHIGEIHDNGSGVAFADMPPNLKSIGAMHAEGGISLTGAPATLRSIGSLRLEGYVAEGNFRDVASLEELGELTTVGFFGTFHGLENLKRMNTLHLIGDAHALLPPGTIGVEELKELSVDNGGSFGFSALGNLKKVGAIRINGGQTVTIGGLRAADSTLEIGSLYVNGAEQVSLGVLFMRSAIDNWTLINTEVSLPGDIYLRKYLRRVDNLTLDGVSGLPMFRGFERVETIGKLVIANPPEPVTLSRLFPSAGSSLTSVGELHVHSSLHCQARDLLVDVGLDPAGHLFDQDGTPLDPDALVCS